MRSAHLACLTALGLALGATHAEAQPARRGPTLALGGDVLYEAPLVYQLRERARAVGRPAALREIFVDLAPALSRADLALVNLEVPVGPRLRERDAEGGMAVFVAPEDLLEVLRESGVDAVTVANNHAFDQGLEGLRHTLAATERHGLRAVGAGEDAASAARAVIVERGGARFAIAAFTEGTNHVPRREDGEGPRIAFLRDGLVEESLRAARASNADLVIAVFHWTHEDLVRPRQLMRATAIMAAEAGADLVVGHGTHVPGSTELIETSDGRRVHVLYSLGNLVAAMLEPAGSLDSREVGVRDAPLAYVRTRWSGERLAVDDVEIVHHWISAPVTRAPWAIGGTMPVSRVVDVRRELARLEAAACGAECTERAAELTRRIALTDRAMARLDGGALSQARIAQGSLPQGSLPQGPLTEPSAPVVAEVTPTVLAPAHIAVAPTLTATAPIAAALERPQPPPPGVEEIVIPVTFSGLAATESSVDDTVIAAIATRMREDRALRVEIVAHATPAEVAELPTVAARRARRVMGLIAIRGPSRTRFTAEAGAARAAPRVVARLTR